MAIKNLTAGDDWIFTATISDPGTSQPRDITGGAVWLTFKSDLTANDTSAEFQVKDLNVQAGDPLSDPPNGVVTLRAAWDTPGVLPPDNTMLAKGNYNYDFQYQGPGSGAITTIERGTVSIVEQVTKDKL